MPAVVGPEVVAPVARCSAPRRRRAGRSGAASCGQLLVAEARVVEPLGADQQHVDLVGRRAPRATSSHSSALAELIVDGPDAGPLGRGDLVAHQRQQRRDDTVGPGARGRAAAAVATK